MGSHGLGMWKLEGHHHLQLQHVINHVSLPQELPDSVIHLRNLPSIPNRSRTTLASKLKLKLSSRLSSSGVSLMD